MLLRLVLLLYELLLSSNITSKEKLNQLKKLQQEQQNYKKTRGEAKKEPKGPCSPQLKQLFGISISKGSEIL